MSSPIMEELLENQTIQNLVADNKALREQLAKWQPDINISYDINTGSMIATITQNNMVASYSLSKEQVEDFDVTTKVDSFVRSLIGDIYYKLIENQIKDRIIALDANRITLKTTGKW
jgi:hypothetical protein